MAKKSGLGRGLSALLGDTGDDAAQARTTSGEEVALLPIDSIDPNADQPRRQFAPEALAQLADSIRSVGILQPVLVQKRGERYSLIAGERRWRAARVAGLTVVPAIVREMDETARLEAALIENLQRDDLNPVDEAMGVRNLMEQCGYTQETAGERLGKSRPAIANLLRLLTLPDDLLEMLRDGRLSAGHGRALAALNDPAMQRRLANLAVAQGWSVRQMERVCATRVEPKEKPKPMPRLPELQELEHMAREAFGTKAELDGDGNRGKLILKYYSAEDLQRIWDKLNSVLSK